MPVKEIKTDPILNEWNNRAHRPGLQSVMSVRWTPRECELATEKLKETIFSFVGNVSGKKILDIGCGIGRFSQDLIRGGGIVTGADFSFDMLLEAKSKTRPNGNSSSNETLVNSNAVFLPFPDGYFDLVFDVTVLIHIVDDTNFEQALTEFRRVTKDKGLIFICEEIRKKEPFSPTQFTRFRTMNQYQTAFSGWKLSQRNTTKCITDLYTLMMWRRNGNH